MNQNEVRFRGKMSSSGDCGKCHVRKQQTNDENFDNRKNGHDTITWNGLDEEIQNYQ